MNRLARNSLQFTIMGFSNKVPQPTISPVGRLTDNECQTLINTSFSLFAIMGHANESMIPMSNRTSDRKGMASEITRHYIASRITILVDNENMPY